VRIPVGDVFFLETGLTQTVSTASTAKSADCEITSHDVDVTRVDYSAHRFVQLVVTGDLTVD